MMFIENFTEEFPNSNIPYKTTFNITLGLIFINAIYISKY